MFFTGVGFECVFYAFSVFYICFSSVSFYNCVGFIFVDVFSIQLYGCNILDKLFDNSFVVNVGFEHFFCQLDFSLCEVLAFVALTNIVFMGTC